MDKLQLISFIKEQLEKGTILKEDLSDLANDDSVKKSSGSHSGLVNVLYGIGAIIAVIGVVILIAQNWNEIGVAGRILVTIGISFATYVSAILLKGPEKNAFSQVMFTISAILAPVGAIVLIEEASIDPTWSVQFFISIIFVVIYGTAFFLSKRSILILFITAFSTWTYYVLLLKSIDSIYSAQTEILQWATILLGASYIFISYGFKSILQNSTKKEIRAIQNVLYGLGTIAILGAGISIGGIFDLIFIAFIFGAFYGSVYLKSFPMLVIGAIFLVAHIIKLTSEYFVDSIGWPVALIGIGFLVIGIGYLTVYLNKKYISKN